MKINIKAHILFAITCLSLNLWSVDPVDTRLLHSPAVSANHLAFIYAEDLWLANLDGSAPRRLTIDQGIESNPVFSPDGSLLAFSAEYDGNIDVFVVPVSGGIPQRLTWHPYADWVRDFSSDGQRVIFASQRNTFTNRYYQLFTVPVSGGQITQLPVPYANYVSVSDDGSYLAYTTLSDPFNQWKHYRGGTQSRIWIFDNSNEEVVEIPKPAAGSNDTRPQWMGGTIYFRSDRHGEFNLYSYNPDTKAVEQLTFFKDFPVMDLTASQGQLIFEQSGYLYRYDLNSGETIKIPIGIATDLLEVRPRYVSGTQYIRSTHISPSGARVLFDFRGDIITVPAKKGDIKNLTMTQGIHEKYPQWSPDGTKVAYFSDESGEYSLHIRSLDSNDIRKISLSGSGFYAFPHWSPDSKHLCYVDNGRNLYLMELATGISTKLAVDVYYFPGAFRDLFGSWSHDSKFVAYTTITDTNYEKAFVYSLSDKVSYPLTDGLSNVSEPTFDPVGKYIYLLASTDAGPVVNWFDQSNQDMEMNNSIYLITLQKDTLSPFFRENDLEKPVKKEIPQDIVDKKNGKAEKPAPPLHIDWTGIENRIVDLPVKPGIYSSLQIVNQSELYYLAQTAHSDGPARLHKYDLNTREDKDLKEVDSYILASGGKKMLYNIKDSWSVSDLDPTSEPENVNLSGIDIKIDPRMEWSNIFNEAWRVNRDYFYDPGMHGADWQAMKTKYAEFLPHLSCSSDLYRVMQWMCSELAVGHHRFGSTGDRLYDPKKIDGGLLGADFEVAGGRYRISKIYGGLNWTPELRSPLTEPGVNVKTGDYILAVNGLDMTSAQNFYSYFENTAEKITTLRVGPNTTLAGSREVEVVPLKNEYALRNRDWVESNMKKVHEATAGQIAYVYVPNTAGLGHQYFKRYFFPQANKKGIIIDERFNGGGQLADYYIDMLNKPYQSYWNFRYGKDLKAPSASIQGPKVMLIDETAGSGGDYLPWMFRKFKMGTLVGKRTWGGLVGVLGFPEFIDGGSVTAPNVAFWTKDGFRIENEGIAPDVEVEQLPKDINAGKDPQLEKAIEIIMKQLNESPEKIPQRPPYPIRVKE